MYSRRSSVIFGQKTRLISKPSWQSRNRGSIIRVYNGVYFSFYLQSRESIGMVIGI